VNDRIEDERVELVGVPIACTEEVDRNLDSSAAVVKVEMAKANLPGLGLARVECRGGGALQECSRAVTTARDATGDLDPKAMRVGVVKRLDGSFWRLFQSQPEATRTDVRECETEPRLPTTPWGVNFKATDQVAVPIRRGNDRIYWR
jgi:hypothetical protein